jgi:hypothetical protein
MYPFSKNNQRGAEPGRRSKGICPDASSFDLLCVAWILKFFALSSLLWLPWNLELGLWNFPSGND